MDHCWDGFYTCQERETRFPTLVYQRWDYNIEYTGTAPQKQEFRLYGRAGSPGFTVTIQYNAAGAYQMYDQDRKLVKATDWDPVTGTWAAVKGQYCGEFRYEGVINRLQFHIQNFHDTGCVLYIHPRDAIMLGIRMEFSLDEFFADGGVVSFQDRMAAVLGIHAADIKVVQVYEGSTIVQFQVLQRDLEMDEEEELLDLSKIDEKYRIFIMNNEYFMESRILNAEVEGVPIISPFMAEDMGLDEDDYNPDDYISVIVPPTPSQPSGNVIIIPEELVNGGDNGSTVIVPTNTGGDSGNDGDDVNIIGDKTTPGAEGDTIGEVIEDKDGNQLLVIKDKAGKVTEIRKVVVEQFEEAGSPLSGGNTLIITGIVIVVLIMIVTIYFMFRKCAREDERKTVVFNMRGRQDNKIRDADVNIVTETNQPD